MNSEKKHLEGSKNRDRFKQLHKELHSQFYSLDIDLALVEKNIHNGSANPCIVAIIDFKMPTDEPTFTEVLTYNQFLEWDIPVYLVESESKNFYIMDKRNHTFHIKQYRGGRWLPDPPTYEYETVLEGASWSQLSEWEDKLRLERRKEVRANNNE